MKRSTGVTVVGVVCILLAALSLLFLPQQISMLRDPTRLVELGNPMGVNLDVDSLVRGARIQMPADLALAAVLLVTGVGILRLKSWALRVALVYACAQMIMVLVGLAVSAQMLRGLAASPVPGARAGAMGGMVGALIGGFAWPIVLLIFSSRPRVREQFLSGPPISHVG